MLIFISCYNSFSPNQNDKREINYKNISLSFEMRAKDLVSRMTPEEKINQLGHITDTIPRLDIPAYGWAGECLHGVAFAGTATVFPQAIGMAASFDRDLMYKTATKISDEARAKHHEAVRSGDYFAFKGLTFWSPNINIFRDPRWGRGQETYGEDPYLTGQMGVEFVRGLQGDDPRYLKVVATAKHFAVHNGPEPERHTFNAVPNMRDLWETYLPACEDLIKVGKAYSVMGAYSRIDGESASASWMLLEDILRKKWEFDGYVVSDCGAIYDIFANHKIANNAAEAAAMGVRRGCDLNCGTIYQEALLDAIGQGLIDEGEIDQAVYRLMLARMKLGMFDPPEMVEYTKIPFEINDSPEHDQVALEMAQKSMTLLKNNGILPLDPQKIKNMAIVGPNAKSVAALVGNYHGEPSHPVTVLEGIKNAAGDNINISYSLGCPIVKRLYSTDDYKVIESQYLSTTDASGKKVQGLKGSYFHGMDLKGEPVFQRIDKKINFDWKKGSPTDVEIARGMRPRNQEIAADSFSIRWEGTLVAPVSSKYKVGLASDDGCRLYLDGELIIDEWQEQGFEAFVKELELERGKEYDVIIEYFEKRLGAGIRFVWLRPDEDPVLKQEKMGYQLTEKTLTNVKNADVAVFVGGLTAEYEGEENQFEVEGFFGGDRTKIELPQIQLDALKAMHQTGTPLILVLLAGSPIAFQGLDKYPEAILLAWYPGQRGGDAVADVLFGDYNPAGRLPVTFYSSTDQLADFRDYNMRAGNGQTYRFFRGEPLFPFGHGLSYTSFEYTGLRLSRNEIGRDDNFTVSVSIRNTGQRKGEEVVQLYIRDVSSDIWMPVKQLRGFERISLDKDEQKTIEFHLNAKKDFRYFNPLNETYMVDPGEFEVQIGASSEDIRKKAIVKVE